MNRTHLSSLSLALVIASVGAPASAQVTAVLVADGALTLGSPYTAPAAASEEPASDVAATSTSPRWRLDFGAPSLGYGGFFAPAARYEREIAALSFDARIVESHGHGVMLRYMLGVSLWGHGQGFDLDYVYRARLAGDDRVGLGLDMMAGLTAGALSHTEETVPSGGVAGGNASLQLDLRIYGFVVSGGFQYRLLLPTEAARNGGPIGPEHAVTATLGLGFGFWG
jgi:hypothetical protein